jgi:hypothetical protein
VGVKGEIVSKFLRKLWARIRNVGESIGFFFLGFGLLVLFTHFALILLDLQFRGDFLLSVWLGLFSVGVGFIAIGMMAKSDKRYTELLERLDKSVARLPTLFKNDVLTPSGQQLAEETRGRQSKEAAQRRLDEDTKRVGYVRGEIFQLKDGSWAIAWGGKYPL